MPSPYFWYPPLPPNEKMSGNLETMEDCIIHRANKSLVIFENYMLRNHLCYFWRCDVTIHDWIYIDNILYRHILQSVASDKVIGLSNQSSYSVISVTWQFWSTLNCFLNHQSVHHICKYTIWSRQSVQCMKSKYVPATTR